jgi:hypothetical protein
MLSVNGVAIAGCANLVLSAQSTAVCMVSERNVPRGPITATYSGDLTFLSSSATWTDFFSRVRTVRTV